MTKPIRSTKEMMEKYFAEGYWTENTTSRLWERIVLIAGSLFLIKPGILTDLLKICGGLLVLVAQAIRVSKDRMLGNTAQKGNCVQ
jgi:UPF0716 family protein affecting phage T7 exclusion